MFVDGHNEEGRTVVSLIVHAFVFFRDSVFLRRDDERALQKLSYFNRKIASSKLRSQYFQKIGASGF